ncbi:hypothetical protein A2886_02370 [candidate division WWE3 bacterium RIFCSPHIGHO2_01_FULL_42_13]|uniref:Uncharacterized protein n=1 Tax=candidate division WWE3 bacterium RIFCSPHIGHO2_01_FULL_42_13 TaxID=1802617 RepID=A0A1F4URR9_UNCKA|nr:MAG: hypothetical protein A2886_02370 [candidate division WWE3 bacterium RIFCSPHIGHO2_01_FULL_42_13]
MKLTGAKITRITNKKTRKNENGQALIFVIATMTVALAVGIGVSLRNLASISRTSRTDTAARAQAAAEGGAENVLSRSEEDIAEMVGDPAEDIVFSPVVNDNITAVASVTVENWNIAASGLTYFPLEIKRDQVSEVKLNGGGIKICWSSQSDSAESDIYYIAYNDTGATTRNGVEANSRSGFPDNYSSGGTFVDASGGNANFDNCYTPTLPSSADGIRIRSINADSRFGIYVTSGSLPDQGYKITSIGRLQNVPAGQEAEVKVTVIRSLPFMPGIFDFSIYSGSGGAVLD